MQKNLLLTLLLTTLLQLPLLMPGRQRRTGPNMSSLCPKPQWSLRWRRPSNYCAGVALSATVQARTALHITPAQYLEGLRRINDRFGCLGHDLLSLLGHVSPCLPDIRSSSYGWSACRQQPLCRGCKRCVLQAARTPWQRSLRR